MSSEERDKKGKRACSECHKSKSKCVFPNNSQDRCERCIRLDKECVPHKSRQGKRKSDYMSDGNSCYSEHSLPYHQQQQQQLMQHSHNLGQQHHHQMEVTSSSQFPTPMAAALAMSNSSTANQSQQYLDMFETIKNGGVDGPAAAAGLVTDTTSAAGLTTANLLNNHCHMSNLLAVNSGNNFSPAAAATSINTHHLAQQIQNNTLFAKNASFLQQQQQQQQSYGAGEGSGNAGLNAILTRAAGDNRIASNTAATNTNGAIDMSGGNLQGFSTNLLSGLTPSALNRMLSYLSNNINNAATNNNNSSGSGGGGGGGDGGSNNNLNLLYQAANSQSSTAKNNAQPQQQQQQHQQGIVNYAAGGNQVMKRSSAPSNSGTNGSNISINNNNNNSESVGDNGGTNSNTSPLPSLKDINNAKGAAAPVSSSNNNIINNSSIRNNNNNSHDNNNTSNNNNNNNSNNNKATINIPNHIRANDSRLKKQKKHHKFFPPEYPPISLLPNHSTSGTPCSSQAGGEVGDNLSRSSSTQNFITPEEAIGNHYMSACARHSELTLASLKYHYGLQCQIREWISMALARRSFALLSKASSLAHRCNMHMDRILSGLDGDCVDEHHTDCGQKKMCAGPRMHYLLSMLLEPRSKISIPIEDRHMLLPHFPPAFLSVIGCQNGQFFQESEIRNRWIIVRETRCGISRFFCSPAFERNVLCWAHVSQIYEDNLADTHSLIFVKDQFRRFLACNAYQIWSHSEKGMPPRPVHAPKTRIRLLSKRWGVAKYQDDGVTNPVTKTMIQQVDDVMTIEMDLLFVSFPTMDKTTYYLEFFHPAKNNNSSATPMNGDPPIARGLSNVSLNMSAGEDLSQRIEQKSPESSSTNPPTFDDIMESEEWVGIDDVMASGDINELMDALLN